MCLQPSKQGKDFAVHFARTPKETFDDLNSLSTDPPRIPILVNSVENINAALVIEHALNALRMVPGCFYILGIFVVSPKSIFENTDDLIKLKVILKQLSE